MAFVGEIKPGNWKRILKLEAASVLGNTSFGNGTSPIRMKTLDQQISQGEISCFRFVCWLLPFSLVLRLGIVDCSAQGTIYTDRALFNATLRSSSTSTFESLTPTSIFSLGLSLINDGQINVTSSGGRLFVCRSPAGLYPYPVPGDGQYLWNFDSGLPIGISLPNGMNAFGADFSGGIIPQNNPFNATITVNLVGGQTQIYNFTGQQGSWTFRGFVFSSPISSVAFNDGGQLNGTHEEMLDNVTFGVVPEPHPLALALAGLVICLFARRVRMSKASLRKVF